jgi:hypothetical protein
MGAQHRKETALDKLMRFPSAVKRDVNAQALMGLIDAAYTDVKHRV